MGQAGEFDDLIELMMREAPRQDDYFFVSSIYWKNPPIVHLLERDNDVFTMPGEDPERMTGWQVEVVHSGKRLFLPQRLLGSRANAMEVLAWASVVQS